MHAVFAANLDTGADLEPDAAVELADHYNRAGLTEPALIWTQRAAGLTSAPAEKRHLLRRALSLLDGAASTWPGWPAAGGRLGGAVHDGMGGWPPIPS